MIKELRVDDRLIHGQVALHWTKFLKVNKIMVANDKVGKDKTQQMALKMAVPAGTQALIRCCDDIVKCIKSENFTDNEFLVIVGNVQDAKTIVDNVDHELIKRINLANVGRFDGVDKCDKRIIADNIWLCEDELEALDYLLKETDIKVQHQIIPTDSARDLAAMV